MHYLLFYEAGEDYVKRRAAFRDEHLRNAWAASDRGELILAGAFANPIDGAVLLFQGDSPEVAEGFAQADPYVTNGVVKRRLAQLAFAARLRRQTSLKLLLRRPIRSASPRITQARAKTH